jgi:hypothetical protein
MPCLISSPSSLQLCVCKSRSSAPDDLLDFKSKHASQKSSFYVAFQVCLNLCVCKSRSSAPDALLNLNSNLVSQQRSFSVASKFVSSCVCANHVPVHRGGFSISSPSSRQLCVCKSHASAPEALLDFKAKLASQKRNISVAFQVCLKLCV